MSSLTCTQSLRVWTYLHHKTFKLQASSPEKLLRIEAPESSLLWFGDSHQLRWRRVRALLLRLTADCKSIVAILAQVTRFLQRRGQDRVAVIGTRSASRLAHVRRLSVRRPAIKLVARAAEEPKPRICELMRDPGEDCCLQRATPRAFDHTSNFLHS